MKIASSWRFIFPTSVVFFFLLVIIALSNCNNNNEQGGDYYYSNGKKIELKEPRDTLGILLRHPMGVDSLRKSVESIGYTYQRSLSSEVALIVKSGTTNVGKKDLISTAIELSTKYPALIQKAGYVTYRKEGNYPVIITNDFVVSIKKGVSDKEINDLFDKYQLQIRRQNPFIKTQYFVRASGKLEDDAVRASRLMAEEKIVSYAHPDLIVVKLYNSIDPTTNILYPLQWYHKNDARLNGTEDGDIDTDLAWNFTAGDSSTIIAIIDRSFDTTHPDLVPNFSYNPSEVSLGHDGIDQDGNTLTDDILGWNFDGCTNPLDDPCGTNQLDLLAGVPGHGTAVMGMAVAVNNGFGIIGSCPQCSVIPIQGGGLSSQDMLAIGYAQSRHVKIISCSWQYADEEDMMDGVREAIGTAFEAGITLFFAASNDGAKNCIHPAIAASDSVIAVSSSTNKELFFEGGERNGGFGDSLDLLAPGGSASGRATFSTLWMTTTDLQGPPGHSNGANELCLSGTNVGADYAKCWDGTSFATPLTAGVAGLILSLDPSLTPKQVQHLLQDCADKMQPSAGLYSPKNGYSENKTQAYGRVNAYEAVKIAAPLVLPGGRGGVDIFVRDNDLDWGNTERLSDTLFESVRQFKPFWVSQDIKVDAPSFEQSGGSEIVIDNNKKFEDLIDEPIRGGTTNRIYVRVRNRGYHPAGTVEVHLYWVNACLAFPNLPPDFWTNFPANSSDITIWNPLPVATISNLAYSGSSVAGSADDDGSKIVRIDFDAPLHDPSLPRNHYCLMALISSPDDPMPAAELSSNPDGFSVDYITTHYNNATHRNYSIDNVNQPEWTIINIFNPWPVRVGSYIEVVSPSNVKIQYKDSLMAREFKMDKGEKRELIFRFEPKEIKVSTEVTLIQWIIDERKKKRRIAGGFTFRIEPPEKK